MKDENSIDNTSLYCALKLRADTRLRALRRATEFMEDTNGCVEEILNQPVPESKMDE